MFGPVWFNAIAIAAVEGFNFVIQIQFGCEWNKCALCNFAWDNSNILTGINCVLIVFVRKLYDDVESSAFATSNLSAHKMANGADGIIGRLCSVYRSAKVFFSSSSLFPIVWLLLMSLRILFFFSYHSAPCFTRYSTLYGRTTNIVPNIIIIICLQNRLLWPRSISSATRAVNFAKTFFAQ